MKYETIKRLKDYGFPQTGKGDYCVLLDHLTTLDKIYIPTLSELIKECGPHFQELKHRNSSQHLKEFNYPELWFMYYSTYGLNHFTHEIEGGTPEEATANLYFFLKDSKILK